MLKGKDDHSTHVRFPDGQDDECNKIHVLKATVPEADVEVRGGFYKTGHKYEITFDIDNEVAIGMGVAKFQEATGSHFKAKQLEMKSSGCITLTLLYFPMMDGEHGVVNELFRIVSHDGDKEIRVIFRAEVLGQGQGTPMLKDGVKCVQRPTSSTSSVSSH